MRIFFLLHLVLVVLIFSPLGARFLAAETVFRVAYEDKTQFPYYMGDTQQVIAKPGAAVELVKLLEEKVKGLRVEFVRYPWKRCLAMLEAGKVDAIFNASFNTDRTRIGVYPWKDGAVDTSRRLTTIGYYLYANQKARLGWDGEAFADKTLDIGAPLGYSIIGDLESLGVSIVNVRSSMQNLRLLAAGRIDAAALQSVTADFLLEKHSDELAGIVRTEPPLKTKPYYLMLSHQFSKKYPELPDQIWRAVAELREEKLDALAQAYLDDQSKVVEIKTD